MSWNAPILARPRPCGKAFQETLTVLRLDVALTLARTLRSTNCVERVIEICRDHSRNVKR
ncbi:MAG: putative transposase [Mycobacterium sp.]|nr:putative transposase [Mycobacterium sp.]